MRLTGACRYRPQDGKYGFFLCPIKSNPSLPRSIGRTTLISGGRLRRAMVRWKLTADIVALSDVYLLFFIIKLRSKCIRIHVGARQGRWSLAHVVTDLEWSNVEERKMTDGGVVSVYNWRNVGCVVLVWGGGIGFFLKKKGRSWDQVCQRNDGAVDDCLLLMLWKQRQMDVRSNPTLHFHVVSDG